MATTTSIKTRTEADRFWEKVVKSDLCWTWIGSRNESGHGRFHYDGRPGYAHRWSYEQAKGLIPPGLEIDHLCRNTSCVRPDHLEAVDPVVNRLRAIGALCKWGHEFTAANTYICKDGSRECRACAREYQRLRKLGFKRDGSPRPGGPAKRW